VTRSGSVSLSANGRAFLFWFLECPCIPNGRAGKGKALPAAWRGRDNWVEDVNLGGNRVGRARVGGPGNLDRNRRHRRRLPVFLGLTGWQADQLNWENVRVGVSGRQPVDPLRCLKPEAIPASVPGSQDFYGYFGCVG